MDLKKEVAHLKEIIAEMSSNEISARISHDGEPEYEIALATLNRLLKNWQIYITRKNKRYKVSGGMQLVFGLYAIHYYLSDEKSFDPKASNAKDAKDSKKDSSSTIELPTFDAFGDEEGLSISTKSSTSKPASSDFPIYKCTMIDVSPTGARVVIDEHSYPPVQSGEIITMRPEHSPEKTYWSIGVVRWLKHSAEGNLHVGIQILAPSGTAAAAQILKDNVGAGYFLRCLLLPEMPDMDTKKTIITPTIPFKKGKDILLYTDDPSKLMKATLTEEVDASGSYRQFEYSLQEKFDNKTLNKTAANEKLDEKQPDNDSEFNLLEDINILNDVTKNENNPNNKDADKKPERFDLDDL